MRSSMYSTRSRFNIAVEETTSLVLDQLKIADILELTKQQKEILEKIRGFMQEQVEGL